MGGGAVASDAFRLPKSTIVGTEIVIDKTIENSDVGYYLSVLYDQSKDDLWATRRIGDQGIFEVVLKKSGESSWIKVPTYYSRGYASLSLSKKTGDIYINQNRDNGEGRAPKIDVSRSGAYNITPFSTNMGIFKESYSISPLTINPNTGDMWAFFDANSLNSEEKWSLQVLRNGQTIWKDIYSSSTEFSIHNILIHPITNDVYFIRYSTGTCSLHKIKSGTEIIELVPIPDILSKIEIQSMIIDPVEDKIWLADYSGILLMLELKTSSWTSITSTKSGGILFMNPQTGDIIRAGSGQYVLLFDKINRDWITVDSGPYYSADTTSMTSIKNKTVIGYTIKAGFIAGYTFLYDAKNTPNIIKYK